MASGIFPTSPGQQSNGALKTTTDIMDATKLAYPCSVQFASSNASRAIDLSIDGTNYFTPTYDVVASAQLVVAVLAPVRNIRFTGAANDVWVIH